VEDLEARLLLDSDVTDPGDAGPGTLRQAILDADAAPMGTHSTITFHIPGTALHTISPGQDNPLPQITNPVTLNATTQFGYTPATPKIELSGLTVGSGYNGLSFAFGSDGSRIQGMIINSFSGTGLVFLNNGNNTILANFIGTDSTGTMAMGNNLGIDIEFGCDHNTIGGDGADVRNLISGNLANGIFTNFSSNNVIKGNFIGTDIGGSQAVGNAAGLTISLGTGDTIGGTSSLSKNLISGNRFDGLQLTSSSTGNQVQGNFIGLDLNGTMPLGNAGSGIAVSGASTGNVIGGPIGGAANLIGANTLDGININTSDGNFVQGNFIGTDVTGTLIATDDPRHLPFGNQGDGINVVNCMNTLIGGTTANHRNLISGNLRDGIDIAGTMNLVEGNYIGTSVTGSVALGNSQNGVVIVAGTANVVGGTVIDGTGLNLVRNIISGNRKDGVVLNSGATHDDFVQGNYIGTDFTGTRALGNLGNGVTVSDEAFNNLIGGIASFRGDNISRNIISGNRGIGVSILHEAATTGNVVQGNYIGTDVTGTRRLGNGYGVGISDGAQGNMIGGTPVVVVDPNNVFSRNIISGNVNWGVGLSGLNTSMNHIFNNYIGTDVTGTLAVPNGEGVNIYSAATNNEVGGTIHDFNMQQRKLTFNVISGNTGDGIRIYDSGTSANRIQGNYIGTDLTGTVPLPNGTGLTIAGGATRNIIGTFTDVPIIGGTMQVPIIQTPNIISGNTRYGVGMIDYRTSFNRIQGNYIGVDITGASPLPNNVGVEIFNAASDNIIGTYTNLGSDAKIYATPNIISANTTDGVQIFGLDTKRNRIQGNFIGLDLNGTVALGNGGNGVSIFLLATLNTVGGILGPTPTPAVPNFLPPGTEYPTTANYIANNGGDGVFINDRATQNYIQGNFIGWDFTVTQPMGNVANGVHIADPLAINNTVGGTGGLAWNTIANSGNDGVLVDSSTGDAIRLNSISNDGNLGIELINNGNTMIPPPSVTSATTTGTTVTIMGSYTNDPATMYWLDFYASAGPNAAGNAEGQRYLGSLRWPGDGSAFSVTFNTMVPVLSGDIVTATATDPLNNTSPFSLATGVPAPSLDGITPIGPDPVQPAPIALSPPTSVNIDLLFAPTENTNVTTPTRDTAFALLERLHAVTPDEGVLNTA
jgi:hypothetical protein